MHPTEVDLLPLSLPLLCSQGGSDGDGGEDDEDEEEEEKPLVRMDDDEAAKNKRLEKKRRLKERFDSMYDDGGDATYFDDVKEEMKKQAEVSNKEP